MRLAAVIIAGGQSSRMGREKAFETVTGITILARIITCLRPQVNHIIINANGPADRYHDMGLPVIADLDSSVRTPLAGLHTALLQATEHDLDAVLTVPSDCPFLPVDLVPRLARAETAAAIAASGGQAHFVTGLWRPALLHHLGKALNQPQLPRLQDWAREAGAVTVEWPVEPYDPFFNVNTPEDLAEANRIAAEFAL
jgi:molybdopterin-guanine dinucleotide biosynthesis protein A